MSAIPELLERRSAMRAWLHSEAVPSTTHVKLCGMSREEDVDAVVQAHPAMCGFIVDFPKSHRSVSPVRLAELTGRLHTAEQSATSRAPIAAVGVFVDKDVADVARIVHACELDIVQLHGHETPGYVAELRRALPETGIIQAFRVHGAADVQAACDSAADIVLLDSGQGSGETFDWSLVGQVMRPFLLAGGLTPGNVGQAIEAVAPWGVDMSSGIETDSVKDASKMQAAMAAVKGARA